MGTPADLLNGTIYALEGDFANAGMSVVGTLPGVGEAVVGGKLVRKGAKVLDSVPGGNKIVSNAADKVDDVASQCKQMKNGMSTGCFTAGTQIVVGMETIEDEHGNLTSTYFYKSTLDFIT